MSLRQAIECARSQFICTNSQIRDRVITVHLDVTQPTNGTELEELRHRLKEIPQEGNT
jgi:hypothetical protein